MVHSHAHVAYGAEIAQLAACMPQSSINRLLQHLVSAKGCWPQLWHLWQHKEHSMVLS